MPFPHVSSSSSALREMAVKSRVASFKCESLLGKIMKCNASLGWWWWRIMFSFFVMVSFQHVLYNALSDTTHTHHQFYVERHIKLNKDDLLFFSSHVNNSKSWERSLKSKNWIIKVIIFCLFSYRICFAPVSTRSDWKFNWPWRKTPKPRATTLVRGQQQTVQVCRIQAKARWRRRWQRRLRWTRISFQN